MRTLFLGCAGALLGILIGLGVLFVGSLFYTSAPVQSNVLAESFSVVGQPDLSVTASAGFVSSQLKAALLQTGLVKQATVTLADPNLVRIATPVDVNVLGRALTVDATLTMSMSVQKGRVVLKVEQVDAAGFNVPSSIFAPQVEKLRSQGEALINQIVLRALQGTRLVLSNIRITPNGLTVDFDSR